MPSCGLHYRRVSFTPRRLSDPLWNDIADCRRRILRRTLLCYRRGRPSLRGLVRQEQLRRRPGRNPWPRSKRCFPCCCRLPAAAAAAQSVPNRSNGSFLLYPSGRPALLTMQEEAQRAALTRSAAPTAAQLLAQSAGIGGGSGSAAVRAAPPAARPSQPTPQPSAWGGAAKPAAPVAANSAVAKPGPAAGACQCSPCCVATVARLSASAGADRVPLCVLAAKPAPKPPPAPVPSASDDSFWEFSEPVSSKLATSTASKAPGGPTSAASRPSEASCFGGPVPPPELLSWSRSFRSRRFLWTP